MTINSSGAVSLAGTTTGQSIELEIGGNGTTTISLNDSSVRTLAGVASGTISMNSFYGKSYLVPISYLVVGAGVGGTNEPGPGGAGGQVLKGTATVTLGVSYSVVVGGGNSSVSVLSLNATAGGGAAGGATTNYGGNDGVTTGLPIVGINPGELSGGVYYVGGGGGAGGLLDSYQAGGAGGLGGGGHGAGDINNFSGTYATPGTNGTGGGGGGGNYTPPAGGGTGVVAFSYAGNARGTGGTISTLNGYTVHIFYSSGTFLLTS